MVLTTDIENCIGSSLTFYIFLYGRHISGFTIMCQRSKMSLISFMFCFFAFMLNRMPTLYTSILVSGDTGPYLELNFCPEEGQVLKDG